MTADDPKAAPMPGAACGAFMPTDDMIPERCTRRKGHGGECGFTVAVPPETDSSCEACGSCRKPILPQEHGYRCTDCDLLMHKGCAQRHFADSKAFTERRLREHASDLEHDHPDSPPMRDKAEAFLDAADMVASMTGPCASPFTRADWTDEGPCNCTACGKAFELVRPGKSQPTCACWDKPETDTKSAGAR